eukprot:gene2265-2577_t
MEVRPAAQAAAADGFKEQQVQVVLELHSNAEMYGAHLAYDSAGARFVHRKGADRKRGLLDEAGIPQAAATRHADDPSDWLRKPVSETSTICIPNRAWLTSRPDKQHRPVLTIHWSRDCQLIVPPGTAAFEAKHKSDEAKQPRVRFLLAQAGNVFKIHLRRLDRLEASKAKRRAPHSAQPQNYVIKPGHHVQLPVWFAETCFPHLPCPGLPLEVQMADGDESQRPAGEGRTQRTVNRPTSTISVPHQLVTAAFALHPDNQSFDVQLKVFKDGQAVMITGIGGEGATYGRAYAADGAVIVTVHGRQNGSSWSFRLPTAIGRFVLDCTLRLYMAAAPNFLHASLQKSVNTAAATAAQLPIAIACFAPLSRQPEQGQGQWRQLAEMLMRISDVGPAFRGLQEEDNQTMLLTLKVEYNYIRSAARKANAPAVRTLAD